MPYTRNNPPDVIKGLPEKAQSIFIAAFNSAFDKYGEESAHKIAWAAVKNAGYHKEGDKWIKSSESIISESVDLSESQFIDTEKVVKNAILIRAGVSKNKRNYSESVLRRDGPSTFEGVNCYSGHVESFFERTNPKNLMGNIRGVIFQESDKTLRGDIHYFDDAVETINKAKSVENKDLLGLSIQTPAKQDVARVGGKLVYEVQSLLRDTSTSVDMVVNPAAGGRLFEAEGILLEGMMELDELKKLMLENIKGVSPEAIKEAETAEALIKLVSETKEPLTLEKLKADHLDIYNKVVEAARASSTTTEEPTTTVKEADVEKVVEARLAKLEAQHTMQDMVREANLPKDMADKVVDKFKDDATDVKAVESEIAFFKNLAARMAASNDNGERIQIGMESSDKMQVALDCLFGVGPEDKKGIKPFRGLREAYTCYTKDVDVTGVSRLTESLQSTSFTYALGTSMHRKLIADYKERDWGWRKICTVGSAENFKTQERVRIGYLGDLEDVNPETADYPEVTDYSDEEATFAINQKGGLMYVTRKHIINDDLNTVSKIVGRLGRAAARTLAKRVFVTRIQGNSTYTPDAGAFFVSGTRTPSNNYNLGATALSQAAIEATITLMEDFRETSSDEKIGLEGIPGSMVLMVPSALKWTAYNINSKELVGETAATANPLQGFFGSKHEDIIVVPLWTDANDWCLAWKPNEIEWIQVNFLQGREEPEMFLADHPLVDQMFVADKIAYKVRHEYEVVFLDCRGAYWHEVT